MQSLGYRFEKEGSESSPVGAIAGGVAVVVVVALLLALGLLLWRRRRKRQDAKKNSMEADPAYGAHGAQGAHVVSGHGSMMSSVRSVHTSCSRSVRNRARPPRTRLSARSRSVLTAWTAPLPPWRGLYALLALCRSTCCRPSHAPAALRPRTPARAAPTACRATMASSACSLRAQPLATTPRAPQRPGRITKFGTRRTWWPPGTPPLTRRCVPQSESCSCRVGCQF